MSRLALLQDMLADEPNEPFLLFAIAKEFEGTNDLTQARTYYEKLRVTNPNYVGTYYHLGKLYEKLELAQSRCQRRDMMHMQQPLQQRIRLQQIRYSLRPSATGSKFFLIRAIASAVTAAPNSPT